MGLLHNLLVLIVFVGPVAMFAYMLRDKLGPSEHPGTEQGLARPRELKPPPLFVVVVWAAALVALILWKIQGDE